MFVVFSGGTSVDIAPKCILFAWHACGADHKNHHVLGTHAAHAVIECVSQVCPMVDITAK